MGHFQGGYVAWVVLFVAGLLETGWAVGLKYTEGFTRLRPTLWTVGAIVASLGLLGIAVKTLPVGTAYTVWAGIGAVGTVTVGILLFGESANPLRLASLALIIAGIVGLRLSAG
jgi:quaternary ammonium compound-resistance protein SugE